MTSVRLDYEALASASDLDGPIAAGSAVYIQVRGEACALLRTLLKTPGFDRHGIGELPKLQLLAVVLDSAARAGRSITFDDQYEDAIWVSIDGGKPRAKPAQGPALPWSIAGTHFETFVGALASREFDGVLGGDEPVIPPTAHSEYRCAPRNALTFARMGVDGVHYAILAVWGSIRDHSPVIQISPMDGDPYVVLGSTFLQYLADGCAVSTLRMESVIKEERAGHDALVPYLKDRFEHSRLFDERRLRGLARFLRLVEKP